MKLNKVIIIAEVGVNHNGNFSDAKKIVKNASLAGADFAKFQLYKTEELLLKSTPLAKYQKKKKNILSQFSLLKKYEIDEIFIKKMKKYCNNLKIKMLVTPFDIKSFQILIKNKFKFIKISSTDLNNHQLLEDISKYNLKIFLSTGMSSTREIKSAIKILISGKIKLRNIILLQCTTSYPARINDTNLKAMINFKKIFRTEYGFSDHTVGNTASIAAVALGAKVIEKHITLNKNSSGPDHSSSLNKIEFINFVKQIKNAEKSVGEKLKIITTSEVSNSLVIRKSIVAIKNIKKGDTFSIENISCKRPNFGISADQWGKVIGKRAKFNFQKDEFIRLK